MVEFFLNVSGQHCGAPSGEMFFIAEDSLQWSAPVEEVGIVTANDTWLFVKFVYHLVT